MVKAFRNFFSRLTQSPEVYPIKFYMKGKRIRRSGQLYFVK
jgi:hypothetical protein